jgi:hypothetical protein
LIRKISELPPFLIMKASFLPSGDHAGAAFRPADPMKSFSLLLDLSIK